jgi:hypothetical protein
MFVVKVWGLSSELTEEQLRSLFDQILDLAKSIPELKVSSERDILVLYPSDRMVFGLGNDLYVEIHHTSLKDSKLSRIEHRFMWDLSNVLVRTVHPSQIAMVSPGSDGNGGYTRLVGATMVE